MKSQGHYIINPKLPPTKANRVDFTLKIGGGIFLSVNQCPYRQITRTELNELRNKYRSNGTIFSVAD